MVGLWAGGEGGEGAKLWLRVLTELRKRGFEGVLMLVCDGLKGLPEAIGEVWPDGDGPASSIWCGRRSGLGKDRRCSEAGLLGSDRGRRDEAVTQVLRGTRTKHPAIVRCGHFPSERTLLRSAFSWRRCLDPTGAGR
ncbi:transposase [Streptomyces sp. NPDC085614]|uniref:transposase n=1 Tax=Streptomyces sp. NPDC085614 TaxID=3365733 RepID=UPI0037CE44CB